MYDRDYGIINFLLNNAGILSQNIAYLQDVKVALPAAMVVNIWKGFPFVAIMLLAGMQSISEDLFEAADIDGASWLQKVRYIIIPGINRLNGSIPVAGYLDDQRLCDRICTCKRRSVQSDRDHDDLYPADGVQVI